MKDMEKLVNKLNEAAKNYYSESEITKMSDHEYDRLYDELVAMEKETGVVLPDSPTLRVGYAVVSGLKKITHKYPALSLDKTKDPLVLVKWAEEKETVLSWKEDGLTLVATYLDGELESAVTRGNGYIGEDVTHNAPYISGLPQKIPATKISKQSMNLVNMLIHVTWQHLLYEHMILMWHQRDICISKLSASATNVKNPYTMHS